MAVIFPPVRQPPVCSVPFGVPSSTTRPAGGGPGSRQLRALPPLLPHCAGRGRMPGRLPKTVKTQVLLMPCSLRRLCLGEEDPLLDNTTVKLPLHVHFSEDCRHGLNFGVLPAGAIFHLLGNLLLARVNSSVLQSADVRICCALSAPHYSLMLH